MALSSLTVGPSAGVVVTGSLSPSLATLGSLELGGGGGLLAGTPFLATFYRLTATLYEPAW